MNHPKHEEWLRYIDGEVPAEERKQLFGHLQTCPDCADRVDAWRRSIGKLQGLSVMERKEAAAQRKRAFQFGAGLKWGLAASILIFIGFVVGRFSMPNEQALEAKVAARVREDARQQLRTDLMAALGPEAVTQDSFQKQLRADLEKTSLGTAGGASWKQEVLDTVQAQRDQDQQQLLGLINHLRDLQVADSLALRQDLETAVLTADRDLRQNNSRINQLASTISATR
jgi:anti-sigma factor RsiW